MSYTGSRWWILLRESWRINADKVSGGPAWLGTERYELVAIRATKFLIVINKAKDENHKRHIVANLGDAEALFENRAHFRSLAKRLLQRGGIPFDDERWGGWLGRYLEKVREAVYDLGDSKARTRRRSLSLER